MDKKTGRRRTFEALLVLALGLLLTALVGCGGAATSAAREEQSDEGPGSSHAGNFAGKVEGTDAFVAVVADREDRALAYVCDGKESSTAEVAEWFNGTVADDGSLDLTDEGGARLVAEVSDEGAVGTLLLGGEEHAFTAPPAEEPAGLYRKEETVDGEGYVGGWILLESGEERGAVKSRSSGFIQSDVDLNRPSRPVNGFIESGIDI